MTDFQLWYDITQLGGAENDGHENSGRAIAGQKIQS